MRERFKVYIEDFAMPVRAWPSWLGTWRRTHMLRVAETRALAVLLNPGRVSLLSALAVPTELRYRFGQPNGD